MIKGISAASISPLFLQHVAEHGLNFGTSEEFNFRQNIFLTKEAENKVINANPEHTFTVGHNFMSTWTDEEYKAMLGYHAPTNYTATEPTVLDTVDIPMAKDWRKYGAVNPIKNQGRCGSCWAFSATCAMEGHHQIQSKQLLSLAEQELVDCDKKCYGCNGGLQDYAMEYVQQNGQVLESDYRYTARDGQCKQSQYKAQVYVSQVHNVQQCSADQLMAAIAQGPTSVTVEADQSVFQRYTSGVLNSADCGTQLDHAITGIGYGNNGSQKYFIVRNSWGANWGQGGYINIAIVEGYSKGICGIQQQSFWPTMKN